MNQPKVKSTKTSSAKPIESLQSPVFPKTLHQVRTRGEEAALGPKFQKRDNIFSKSRDTREDRGARQAKTSKNPQTLPHGR
jgi:hypothetical protein